MSKCKVTILRSTVVKVGDPLRLEVEVAKMKEGRRIGQESGLFTVPKVLDFDSTSGTLTMERVQNLHGIRRAQVDPSVRMNLIRDAGRALAAIHAKLSLPDAAKRALPAVVADAGSQSFIHGDYSTENVAVAEGKRPQLVIIDWQMSALYGGEATWGTPNFDVCWFISNLYKLAPRPALLKVGRLADIFVEGYFGGDRNRLAEMRHYQRGFYTERVKKRRSEISLIRRLALRPSDIAWRAYIEEVT